MGKTSRFYGKVVVKCPESCKGKITIGENCTFNSSYPAVNPVGYNTPCVFRLSYDGELNFGNNVGVSNSVFVSYKEPIIVHDYVTIGGGCKFYTTDFHPIEPELRKGGNFDKAKMAKIEIGENAFIGAGTTVLKGVTIGKHSIIGACSVVTKDVPDNEIWAGNPARFVKKV